MFLHTLTCDYFSGEKDYAVTHLRRCCCRRGILLRVCGVQRYSFSTLFHSSDCFRKKKGKTELLKDYPHLGGKGTNKYLILSVLKRLERRKGKQDWLG